PVSLAVTINGRVPSETEPDRVRALLRYSATEPSYEELPLEKGANKHEWSVEIPPHLVQNGFWYKVAAGDAETEEYRVTVRTPPEFRSFDIEYEYPKYLRIKPDPIANSTSPDLYGYRGAKVALIAHANREVRDGHMDVMVQGKPERIEGERINGKPDVLR